MAQVTGLVLYLSCLILSCFLVLSFWSYVFLDIQYECNTNWLGTPVGGSGTGNWSCLALSCLVSLSCLVVFCLVSLSCHILLHVSLDIHCECDVSWLEPVLEVVALVTGLVLSCFCLVSSDLVFLSCFVKMTGAPLLKSLALVWSCFVPSCLVLSHSVLLISSQILCQSLALVWSCPILLCLVPSCLVLFHPVQSCPIPSCLVPSCPLLSHLVLSHPVLSCPILSSLVVFQESVNVSPTGWKSQLAG